MLAYLSRYTHRVAISNSRLIAADAESVTFKVKNYRAAQSARLRHDGAARYTTMTLDTGEFIRRFLLHVLPKGLHRIRHYGLLATGTRASNIVLARKRLGVEIPECTGDGPADEAEPTASEGTATSHSAPCPCCGGPMRVIEIFRRGETTRHRPSPWPPAIRIDTS